MSEMLLLGTTVDFIEEDYSKNIFESRFIFTPEKGFCDILWMWHFILSEIS